MALSIFVLFGLVWNGLMWLCVVWCDLACKVLYGVAWPGVVCNYMAWHGMAGSSVLNIFIGLVQSWQLIGLLQKAILGCFEIVRLSKM